MFAFSLAAAFHATAALVVGPRPGRKALALALTALTWPALLYWPPEGTFLTAWVWMASIFLSIRHLDVRRECAQPAAFRVALQLLILDPRTFRWDPPRFDFRLAGTALGWSMLVAASAVATATLMPPWRWIAAAAFLYSLMETGDRTYRVFLRALGATARTLQDAPIRSRSLGEFWGRRWNREVSGALARHVYRPLARHRALAVLATFAASGALHALPTAMALGWQAAPGMQLFFLLHGGLVLVEAPLGVARWPRVAGHAWVLGTFALTGPLFLEPGLRMLGFD